ncbi:MAG: peptidylprolyl isomerase [Candidatus Margulisbacteria bacterium]|nr:peptidylprolyl isomerase [Candidatus Margulisiibacteriota bacterium]
MKTHFKYVSLIIISISLINITGCEEKKDVVAKINNDVITIDNLNARFKMIPKTQGVDEKQQKNQLLITLVNYHILLKEAKKLGFDKQDQYVIQTNQILVNMLIREKIQKNVQVSDEDLKAYYSKNVNLFKSVEQRRAQHILVSSEKEAKSIIARLQKGDDFSNLAKELSIDQATKSKGGELGWFVPGMLVPEFEKAAFGIGRKGSISSSVKTQFGYHIIKLMDVSTRPKVGYDQAKDQIFRTVQNQKQTEVFSNYLKQLKEKYKITTFTDNIM